MYKLLIVIIVIIHTIGASVKTNCQICIEKKNMYCALKNGELNCLDQGNQEPTKFCVNKKVKCGLLIRMYNKPKSPILESTTTQHIANSSSESPSSSPLTVSHVSFSTFQPLTSSQPKFMHTTMTVNSLESRSNSSPYVLASSTTKDLPHTEHFTMEYFTSSPSKIITTTTTTTPVAITTTTNSFLPVFTTLSDFENNYTVNDDNNNHNRVHKNLVRSLCRTAFLSKKIKNINSKINDYLIRNPVLSKYDTCVDILEKYKSRQKSKRAIHSK